MAWKKNGSNWQYTDSNGKATTGWQKVGGKWYYMDKSGNMKTGWVQSGGKWYYLNKNGDMRTGWVKDKGNWYYLGDDGAMATGAQNVNGQIYGFDNSGKMTYEDKPFSYSSSLDKQWQNAAKQYDNIYNNPSKYGYDAYKSDVNALFNSVMNQEEFSYDPQKDALFQMYKQQYNAQGNRGMKNQMGVAAARSGGYNSSAAQTSAQSVYQGYMDALNEKASETYQNALDFYNNQQQNLLNRYNTALSMNNASNDAYNQRLQAAQQRASQLYGAFTDDRNYAYNKWNDNRQYMQTQAWNKQSNALQKKLYLGK